MLFDFLDGDPWFLKDNPVDENDIAIRNVFIKDFSTSRVLSTKNYWDENTLVSQINPCDITTTAHKFTLIK